MPALLAMGVAIFAGSLLTALLLRAPRDGRAPRRTRSALAALVAVDVLPRACCRTPKPSSRFRAWRRIIERERRAGDAVAIQSVSGGNALLFYTRPVVNVLAPPSGGDAQTDGIDPRGVICRAPRAWVVAPAMRPAYDPPYGRRRTLDRGGPQGRAAFSTTGPPAALTSRLRLVAGDLRFGHRRGLVACPATRGCT